MIKHDLIGGEFYGNKFYQNNPILNKFKYGSWTLSGRSALELIIQNNPKLWKETIYLPLYNCSSIYKVVKKFFKKIIFYDLKNNFEPKIKKFKKNSVLILVNYFGHKSISSFDKNLTIIEDLSHLLLNNLKFKKNRIYFLSLRKFGIFNFGGWTNLKFNNIYKTEINFLESFRKKKLEYVYQKSKSLKIEHQLLNLLKKEEEKIFKKNLCIPKKQIKALIKISDKKLISIRKLNFNFLKKNIKFGFSNLVYKKNETPLFFFIKFLNIKKRDEARNFLKKKNIFCPILWNLSNYNLNKYPNAKEFSEKMLALPIDHRLNIENMKHILKTLKKI